MRKGFTLSKNQKSSKGLSLVESAIILIILGLLVAVGTQMLGNLIKRNKLNTTRDLVKTAKEALIGYAIKNNRLPCPDTNSDGQEDCPYSPSSPYKNTRLPYITLGMKGKDAYLKQLYYDVNESLTSSTLTGYDFCVAVRNISTAQTWPDPPRVSQNEGQAGSWNAAMAVVLSTSENMSLDPSINSNTSERSYESKGVTSNFDDEIAWIDVGTILSEKKCQECTSYTVYNWNSTGGPNSYYIWVKGGIYKDCTRIAPDYGFNVRLGDLVVVYCDAGCSTYCVYQSTAMVTYWRLQEMDSEGVEPDTAGTPHYDCIVNGKTGFIT